MTHLVTPKLGELIGSGGTLLMETPLFLLQVTPLSFSIDFVFLFSFPMIFLHPVDRRPASSVPREGDGACRWSWTAVSDPELWPVF